MATEDELNRQEELARALWKANRERQQAEERAATKSQSSPAAAPPPQSHGGEQRSAAASAPKVGMTPAGKQDGRRKEGKVKSSSKSSRRRKAAEAGNAEREPVASPVTAANPTTTPAPMRDNESRPSASDEGEERAGTATDTDARLPEGSHSSSAKVRHEALPQDRTYLNHRPQEEIYKGDPITSPEPFQLFSPASATETTPTPAKGKSPAPAPTFFAHDASTPGDDFESAGGVLTLVRDEIDRLAEDIDAIGELPDASAGSADGAADDDGDKTGTPKSPPEPLQPDEYTERIGRSLEIMGRRADVMAEALERNYARTEALEKENTILREMCRRLVKSEHRDFMAEMLAAVGTMKAALCTNADGMRADGGGGSRDGAGGGTATLDSAGITMDALSGLNAVIANATAAAAANGDIPGSLLAASPDETDGIRFVADLAEVMSIQTGHHGLLAGIMDRHLAMEVDAGDVDVNPDRPS